MKKKKLQHQREMRILKALLTTIVAITLTTCFLLKQQVTHPHKAPKQSAEDIKTILFWNPMFDSRSHYLGLGSGVFKNCPFKNCYSTDNKYHLPQEEFDAIIFHGKEYNVKYFGKPLIRKQDQIYIFSDMESPVNNPRYVKEYNNFYNWTITYKTNSDVPRLYGYFSKQSTNYTLPSLEFVAGKVKKIAWMVSDCKTHSRREEIVRNLSKLMPVDVYGACGNLTCPRSMGNKCYKMVEENYKFYLAFENSVCNDYVTEKLFNIMKYNIIPIVYGGANYSTIAPSHSYIDILDFDSLESLVEYLTFLDKNPEEYLNYLKWKSDYVVGPTSVNVMCELCRKLNEKRSFKTYDIWEWFNGPTGNECWLPSKLFP